MDYVAHLPSPSPLPSPPSITRRSRQLRYKGWMGSHTTNILDTQATYHPKVDDAHQSTHKLSHGSALGLM